MSGENKYPSVGCKFPDDGLLRSAHSDAPALFQAESPKASSKKRDNVRKVTG
jgi:hypothetical protein